MMDCLWVVELDFGVCFGLICWGFLLFGVGLALIALSGWLLVVGGWLVFVFDCCLLMN